ncbi:hypothetical protein BSNK01_26220 [Bacillaceae bacterium]
MTHKDNKNILLNYMLILVLFGSYLSPEFEILNLSIRISDIIILTVLPLLFLLKPKIPLTCFSILYLTFFISMIFSTLYGYAFLNVPPSVRDLNELLRMFLPFILIITVYISNLERLIELMNRFFLIGSFFIITVAFLQYFSPTGLGYIVASWYGGEHHLQNLLMSSNKRIFVTGSDPNVGAAIISVFLFYNLLSLLIYRRVINFIAFSILGIIILLTASRTTLVGVGLSLILMVFLIKEIKVSTKIIALFTFFLICFFIIPKIEYITLGFIYALEGKNQSLLVRFENFYYSIELFRQSVVFGWGPAKSIHPTIVDGEYFLLLRRYGLFGFMLFIFLLLYILLFTRKYVKKYHIIDKNIFLFGNLTILSVIVFLIIMLTNNFISGYQLFYPFIIMFSTVYFKIIKTRIDNSRGIK